MGCDGGGGGGGVAVGGETREDGKRRGDHGERKERGRERGLVFLLCSVNQ